MAAIVERLEYDPNRTAFIALIKYADGELSYILAPQRLAVGDTVVAGQSVDVKPGNAMPLGSMPVGTIVHNVETKPGKGGSLARAAGTYAMVAGRDQGYVLLKLKSGETRMVDAACMASVGAVSNPDHINEVIGKAGRSAGRAIARCRAVSPATRSTIRTAAVPTAASTGQRPGASRPRARRPARTSQPRNSSCAAATIARSRSKR